MVPPNHSLALVLPNHSLALVLPNHNVSLVPPNHNLVQDPPVLPLCFFYNQIVPHGPMVYPPLVHCNNSFHLVLAYLTSYMFSNQGPQDQGLCSGIPPQEQSPSSGSCLQGLALSL